MSQLLRLEMIGFAIAFITLVISNVNRRRLQIRYSIIWLAIAFGMIILAFLPGIAEWLCSIMQIQEPSNLIFFLAIFCLLVMSFSFTKHISNQAERLTRIIQLLSIETYMRETNERGVSHEKHQNQY